MIANSIQTHMIKEKETILDPLIEKAEDFGKTSLELFKLRAIDKSSDIVSTLIPVAVVLVFTSIFLLFINLGIAFWLGGIWGSIYLGFFAVAAFYIICGLIIHFFLHKTIKERIRNVVIKLLIN
jgi:phosphoglycerol transferase MdoB-like AlkP superfamily enzyme